MSNSYLKETYKMLEIARREEETRKINETSLYLSRMASMVEKEAE